MTQTRDDNRPQPFDSESFHHDGAGDAAVDPLDEIDAALEQLGELDPAEAVTVLSDVTAELNKELDADTERS